ncbi:MAG: hypothetical protein KGJ68_11160, partial [Gammaproteobacteria bacterium]|nr:hypothetical protein [Gammaproteobacteria bacterium]
GLGADEIAAPLARLLGRGLLERTAGGYRASALGSRFLNDLLTEFMAERPKTTGASAMSIVSAGGVRDSLEPLFTGAGGAFGE